jgi:hypothetical protein|tara:strand:+ start:351 stop:599 length:249 start_codon:yes stop_codon:yes gene_type:complete
MIQEKIKLAEPLNGFTERDKHSKAILNTDVDSYLKHKIQRRNLSDINRSTQELGVIRNEVNELKKDLTEIKTMLLQITNSKR